MASLTARRSAGDRRGLGVPVLLCSLALLALIPSIGLAQPAPPQLTAPVNDFAGIIDEPTRQELDRRIRALQTASGDVVVVATVKTFQPFATIEEYAVRMFENGGRGIGQKGRDNGLLLLIAVDDRAMRIETGYDLEEFVPDGYAGETIRSVIAPEFRSGNFSRGILLGTTRLINRIADRRGVTLEEVPRERRPSNPSGGFPVGPLIFLIILIILFSRGGRRRRRGHWGGGGPWSGWNSGVGPFGGGFGGFGGGFGGRGGGGFGGGFGGFGGGRSGGGGASGGW